MKKRELQERIDELEKRVKKLEGGNWWRGCGCGCYPCYQPCPRWPRFRFYPDWTWRPLDAPTWGDSTGTFSDRTNTYSSSSGE